MTQTPQSDEISRTVSQDAQRETSPPAFRPYRPPEPIRRSRKGLILIGLSVVAVIGGMVFFSTGPDEAEGHKAPIDVRKMSAEQLARDSGPGAARELVRRLLHGTQAEHIAASNVMNRPRSQRLSRNLAMAMALEQQKRANDMRLRTQREMRLAEQGY